MMWYYGGGAGWVGWLLMSVSMIVFWGILIGLAVWAVRSFTRSPQARPPRSSATSILEERLARGEISVEEYNQRKQALESPG